MKEREEEVVAVEGHKLQYDGKKMISMMHTDHPNECKECCKASSAQMTMQAPIQAPMLNAVPPLALSCRLRFLGYHTRHSPFFVTTSGTTVPWTRVLLHFFPPPTSTNHD